MKKKKDTSVNILLILCILMVLVFLAIVVFIALKVAEPEKSGENSIDIISSESVFVSSVIENNTSSQVYHNGLDPDYSRLILVNGENPLDEDYDYEGNLATIDKKYLCGYRNQMDKDVMPYAVAMVEAAWKDNVELYILSPYRSYSSQVTLFDNEVAKQKKSGISQEEAEIKASTVVARPGTSEHHTGLAIDFNSVEDTFEDTEAYTWLKENAAEYGFIMRYSKEKQPITGVINESWHWRFIGIKHAKAINELDMCLEEYVDYLNTTADNTGSKRE